MSDASGSVVGIGARLAYASGWVAHANGLIVTNHHVVAYLPRVLVRTRAGRELGGRVVYVDPRLDLAFVMPEETLDLPPLPRADSRALKPGDPVSAIGHPFGLDHSLTRGVISATKRRERGREFLQTDAVLNPGNSGGPLLDAEGRVVGVNTCSVNAESVGLNLAIPVHSFEEALARFAGPDALNAVPKYACAECDATIRPDATRCDRCGSRILYLDEPLYAPPEWIRAEHRVEILLRHLGLIPNALNVGTGVWFVESKQGEFLLSISEDGEAVEMRTRIVSLPPAHQEMFLRFVLTANDAATGDGRLSIRRESLEFSRREPAALIDPESAPRRMKEFGATAAKLRSLLMKCYGAAAPVSFSQDGVK